jgi:hypothetical protein
LNEISELSDLYPSLSAFREVTSGVKKTLPWAMVTGILSNTFVTFHDNLQREESFT